MLLAVAVARCAPGSTSIPGSLDIDEPLQVMTWNLEVGAGSAERALAGLQASDARLIAMQELQPDASRAIVFAVHPLPAVIGTFARIPVSLETARRDGAIAHIRARIDEDIASGRPVIVLGDINTTEREPAYAEFSADLRDAHLDAGWGPGLTWRPASLSFLPFGLLRIDYVFASPPFAIDSTFVDCSLPSDHCRLEAGIQLGEGLGP